jgi:phosphatidylserine/phosphatidylglycerophosphate/cardiolipin synthase-like enzyme
MKAVALANSDIVFIAWRYQQKIEDCLGFAIFRIDLDDASKKPEPLPAFVCFGPPGTSTKRRTTVECPIQKFQWRDLFVRRDGKYQYRVVPMVGTPKNLKPRDDLALTTNEAQVGPVCGKYFQAYFNRGILSTQSLAHKAAALGSKSKPNFAKPVAGIKEPGNSQRENLARDLLPALRSFFDRAKKDGGHIYAALYELKDKELENLLKDLPYVHLVLSNAGNKKIKNYDETNVAARVTLHDTDTDITDRFLGTHIGHNKFLVYADDNNKPKAVLTGSTNWTTSGVCAQSNNIIIVESPQVAKLYYQYWVRLRKEKNEQNQGFRSENNDYDGRNITLGGNESVSVWFSPNTERTSYSTAAGSKMAAPSDMQEVFAEMSKAQHAILFLAFKPGKPSIITELAHVQQNKPDLLIHGAVTDPDSVDDFNTYLYHRTARVDRVVKPEARINSRGKIVNATEIKDEFSYWYKEMLKLSPFSHAIIHDKIMVIDPLSPNCVVVTGSHNLGYKASVTNDENMLIIRGNRELAMAYAAHIMDVYDHYRFRWNVQAAKSSKKPKKKIWDRLEEDDSWQDRYFINGRPANREMVFWTA